MSQNIYYNKYIKYKTKYFQLAGNFKNNNNILDTNRCIEDSNGIFVNLSDCITSNIWKDNYIELYNILLNVVSNPNIILNNILTKIQSLCILLFENLKMVYNNSNITNAMDKRIINYNMRFIINIVSMIINEPFVSSINDKIKIQFNKEQSLDKNNFYYLEDAFTNDLDLFFSEYDKLIKDKRSIFFYRSNIVNISILLKCFSDRCIEQLDKTNNFYNNLYEQFTSDDFKNIHNNFNLKKYNMIKLLLESYSDFSYEKIKTLYIEYLKFYYENFNNLELVVTQKDKLEQSFQSLNEIIGKSGRDYFVYLSCNIPSEFKFQKFEATKILISYLGFRENSDNFYNSIDIIEHDFGNTHDQYKRKLSYTDDELLNLRAFLKLLYESFNLDQTMLEKIITFIHISNYENNIDKLNIIKFIQQLSQKLIFKINGINGINDIIVDYLETYLLNWPGLVNGDEEVCETNKIIELLKDKRFKYRLFYNFQVERKKIKLLEQQDKNLLIKYINKVVENIGILDEIKKFLFDNTYTIELSKELNSNQILLIKKIIRKTNDIDIIYTFTGFLYNNYTELFGNNKIYENLKTLLN